MRRENPRMEGVRGYITPLSVTLFDSASRTSLPSFYTSTRTALELNYKGKAEEIYKHPLWPPSAKSVNVSRSKSLTCALSLLDGRWKPLVPHDNREVPIVGCRHRQSSSLLSSNLVSDVPPCSLLPLVLKGVRE